MRSRSLLVLIALALTALLFIVVTASRPWQKYGSVTAGLWSLCVSDFCGSYSATDSTMKSVRAFMVIAIITEIVACVLTLLKAFDALKFNLFIPILITAAGGAACCIIGLVIYAANYSHFGWMFYVGWVAGVIGIIAVVGILVFDRSNE